MAAIYKTNTINCSILSLKDPQIPCPVAYITLTDLVIGDVVTLHGTVRVTTEKDYNTLWGRYAKVDKTLDTNQANGDQICRAMATQNIRKIPNHYGIHFASGFHEVTRNGSIAEPHVFMLIAYCASSSAAVGDCCTVSYVDLQLMVD